jgi:hypothetical protein
MPSISMQPGTDPVSQAIARSAQMAGAKPVPLISTAYDINIRGGLADVLAVRTFRNTEQESIEATLTFPVPVHAVLYSLDARIGERTVKAVARAKTAARQTYEDAVDQGKTTILHEELLKGVHLLSVGHIAPKTEIAVAARFAVALARIGNRMLLHIPTTVGDIYGQSGLPDSDDFCHGGPAQEADLKVTTDAGEVVLLGGQLTDGTARIPLDAPIHIEVKDWRARALQGRAADGRSVTLTVEPAPAGDGVVSAAILIDHSGSMGELCAGNAGLSKHAAALLGLSEAAPDVREGDQLHLWEFNDHVRDLGRVPGKEWRPHIRNLSAPSGGTEIGRALEAVVTSGARDIILVTDGKSHALDVGKLASSGARFTVVLIGEDSLEVNVGYLAALTGGDIFVPDGADVTDAVRSAVCAIRQPPGDPREAHLRRSGMVIRASWKPDLSAPASARAEGDRAAAAYAAGLLLVSLNEKEATVLAEMEGLVTHLTSLVLVDEQGAVQTGQPAMRKVALPTPRTSMRAVSLGTVHSASASSHARSCPGPTARIPYSPREMGSWAPMGSFQDEEEAWETAASTWGVEEAPTNRAKLAPEYRPRNEFNLAGLAASISWSALADGAVDRKLRRLDRAKLPLVRKVATELGLLPVALVLGLMARFMAGRDRHAAGIARALLGGVKVRALVLVAELLDLVVHEKPVP